MNTSDIMMRCTSKLILSLPKKKRPPSLRLGGLERHLGFEWRLHSYPAPSEAEQARRNRMYCAEVVDSVFTVRLLKSER